MKRFTVIQIRYLSFNDHKPKIHGKNDLISETVNSQSPRLAKHTNDYHNGRKLIYSFFLCTYMCSIFSYLISTFVGITHMLCVKERALKLIFSKFVSFKTLHNVVKTLLIFPFFLSLISSYFSDVFYAQNKAITFYIVVSYALIS